MTRMRPSMLSMMGRITSFCSLARSALIRRCMSLEKFWRSDQSSGQPPWACSRWSPRGGSTIFNMTCDSHSVEETESIAAGLARLFVGGEVIALHGEMGAGKTQFVRGLLLGLGGEVRSVSSPTFVLLNVYDSGRLTLYHLDAYRVSGPEDFEGIGFTGLLDQAGVVAVEWPQRVAALVPANAWEVTITAIDQSTRQIQINDPAGGGR